MRDPGDRDDRGQRGQHPTGATVLSVQPRLPLHLRTHVGKLGRGDDAGLIDALPTLIGDVAHTTAVHRGPLRP